MLIVIGVMMGGILLGYMLRKRNLRFIPGLITCSILALLLLLGVSVGANERIMDNLHTIGVDALLITCGAVAGSVFCAWGVYTLYFKN